MLNVELLRVFLVTLKCSFSVNHHMLTSKPNSKGIGTSAYELYFNTLKITLNIRYLNPRRVVTLQATVSVR